MSMRAVDVIRWLRTLGPEAIVGIDEDGMCLRVAEAPDGPDAYLELGALPDEEAQP